jgi:MFS family permease
VSERRRLRFAEIVTRSHSLPEVESGELPATSSNLSGAEGGERGVGKRSIVIMLCVNFLANLVFSIVIPSLWPFLEHLGQDKGVLGWAIACNSAGTFISAPLLGAWADKWHTRGVMIFSLLVMIAGNVVYSLAYNRYDGFSLDANLAMLMVGRFLVGFAAGNFSVIQSYFSYATKPSQRLTVMSWNAGTTVIGFVVGPAIAAACVVKNVELGPVVVNAETLPGFLSGIAALLGVVAMFFVEDVQRPSAAALAREGVQAIAAAAAKSAAKSASAPRSRGERQSLLGGDAGGRASAAAVRSEPQRRAESVANYGAWLFGGSGYFEQSVPDKIIGAANPAIDDRAKTWTGAFPSDRHASIVSYASLTYNDASVTGNENLPIPWKPVIICLLLNFAVTLTFTALETIGPPYTAANTGLRWTLPWQNGVYFMVLGFICIFSLVALQFVVKCVNDRVVLPMTCVLMAGGYALSVNFTDAYPPVYCFYLSSLLTSVGYASGTAVLIAIYSKVLDGLDQGVFMGAFSAACSVARIVGPLGASYMLQIDPMARWVFGGISIMLFLSAVLSAASYNVLKPRCEAQATVAVAGADGDEDAPPSGIAPRRGRVN